MFFEYPKLLFGELILIPLIALYIFKELKGVHPALTVSNLDQWKKGGKTLKVWLRHLPFICRMVAIALIIVAIARPRSSEQFERMDTEGIDIVLDMDVSTSMLARDFSPDRIGAAKDIAIEFIAS
ncbi:MAG: BatA domain-containing protein, partial [Bacteroidales bacterium]|nr:BatA domain-containing protein [Bacteroidales bacterium]